MRISTFTNKYDTEPELGAVEFGDLPAILQDLADSNKETAALWSPAVMEGGKTEGHTKSVEALALDFDGIEPPWERLAGWSYFAHTTHSHMTVCEKNPTGTLPFWRVVVELDQSCAAGEWKARFKSKCAVHQFPCDPKCCNPNRGFFVPPTGAEWRTNEGEAAQLPSFEQASLPIQEDKTLDLGDGLENDGSAFWPSVVADMQRLPASVSGQGGDDRLYEAACILRKGYRLTPGKCLEALRIFNERCKPQWDDARLIYKIGQAVRDTQHEAGGLIPKNIKDQLARESPDGWVVELHAALARYLKPAGVPVPMKWDAIMAPLPPVDWLCRGLGIAPGRPTIISGMSGAGKTLAVQELALAVASGQPVFDSPFHRVRKGGVLHIDIDQGSEPTRRRYQQLVGKRADSDLELIAFSFNLTTVKDGQVQIDYDALFHLALLSDGKALVIIDSLRGLSRGLEENSSAFGDVLGALTAVSNALAEVRGRTPPVFVVIHHSGKPQQGKQTSLRGSSAIRDRSGCVWILERFEGETQTTWHQDKVSESTVKGVRGFATKLEEGPTDQHGEPTWVNIRMGESAAPGVQRILPNVARMMAAIMSKADGQSRWFTRDELIQGAGKTKDAAAAVTQLLADKRLNTKQDGKRTMYSAVLLDPKS